MRDQATATDSNYAPSSGTATMRQHRPSMSLETRLSGNHSRVWGQPPHPLAPALSVPSGSLENWPPQSSQPVPIQTIRRLEDTPALLTTASTCACHQGAWGLTFPTHCLGYLHEPSRSLGTGLPLPLLPLLSAPMDISLGLEYWSMLLLPPLAPHIPPRNPGIYSLTCLTTAIIGIQTNHLKAQGQTHLPLPSLLLTNAA